MSAFVNSIENHKDGSFRVDVRLGDMYRRFESVMGATKWLNLMKLSGEIAQLQITLREIVITAKRQLAYESCYAL